MSHSPVSNGGPLSHSSSSIPATSSLPARQEVTAGARVHGDWCSGAAGLPPPVEQRPTSLSGVQLLHPARLQAAGVPEPHTPAAPPACCPTGRAQTFMLVCLIQHLKIKALVRNCVKRLELHFLWFSGPGCCHILPPGHLTGCECFCESGVPQYQPVCHPHCGHCPAMLETGSRDVPLYTRYIQTHSKEHFLCFKSTPPMAKYLARHSLAILLLFSLSHSSLFF